MSNWARIEGGRVAEITSADPAGRFHKSIKWVSAPSDVAVGDLYDGETFSKPAGPTQSELDAKRVNEIDARLKEIDAESVRPLRTINNGNDTQFDRDRLAELDAEADELRTELGTLV